MIDEISAMELLHRFDYLPLAIAQAGAYLSVQRQSFEDVELFIESKPVGKYLTLYERNAKTLLNWLPSRGDWTYRNKSVLTTWEISFQSLEHTSPLAAKMLLLCGFFGSSEISEDIFRYGWNLASDGTQSHMIEPPLVFS